MGIANDIMERLKYWTVGKPSYEIEEHQMPNLGAEIQQVMHTPQFETAMNTASPFLYASLGAWPGYWLYRGIDYHSHRAHVPLPSYIRQTFYQAKFLQLVIIMAGIAYVVKDQKNSPYFNVDNKQD